MQVILRKRVRNTLHIFERDSVMIHTGLSVVVCGHRISIVRDEVRKIANVVILPIDDRTPQEGDGTEIQEAIDSLIARAKRFLGREWQVRYGLFFEGER